MEMSGKSERMRGKSTGNQRVVTIYDIAKQAGVSKSTVSRVITGEGYVHPDTRAVVERAIEDFRFNPNRSARNLSNGSETRIALVYSNPSVAYFTELLMGALESSSRNGAHLIVEKCPADNLGVAFNSVRSLAKAGSNGIILATPLSEQGKLIKELTEQGVAVVGIATGRFRDDVSCVDIDNYKAAYKMVSYLISLGHEKIGFIQGHPDIASSELRFCAVKDALRDAGIGEPVVAHGRNSYRSGLDAAKQILSGRKKVTAIFANNDDMASAAMSMAHRRGLRVPQDLSVVGFDDTIAGTTWPELTTIRQGIADIASTAIDLAVSNVRLIRSGAAQEISNRLIQHNLVIRESACPPQQGKRARIR